MKIGRKLLVMLLTLAMVLSVICPVIALADDGELIPRHTENVECKRDVLTLRGILTMPDYYEGDKLPMVILSHGFMSSNREMANAANSLAGAGYASVRFDFGGSASSDGEFVNMTTWTEVDDLNAILDYVETLDFVDLDNIFLSGNSFGGVVTALTAPQRAGEINSICLWYPAMSMCDDARGGHVQDVEYDPNNLPDTLNVHGYTVGKAFLEANIALDPYVPASEYKGDVLILHGTADNLVPISASEKLVDVLESATLVPVQGGGHGFWGASFNAGITEMIKFLDAHRYSVDVGTANVTVDDSTAAVNVTYNGTITASAVTVQLSSDFDLVSVESDNTLYYSTATNKIIVYNLNGINSGDVLFSATFNLGAEPVPGNYKIGIDVIDAVDANDNLFDIAGVSGYIVVKDNFILGDVDQDGILTTADAILIARYILGSVTFTKDQLKLADIDGDGTITTADLVRLARLIVAQ